MNVELGEIELQREFAVNRNPCAVTLSETACLPPAGKKWTQTGKKLNLRIGTTRNLVTGNFQSTSFRLTESNSDFRAC